MWTYTTIFASLLLVVVATAWLLRSRVRAALVDKSLRVASWCVAKAYSRYDGLESIEVVFRDDSTGAEVCAQLVDPSAVVAAAGTSSSVSDFLRISVPSDEVGASFKVQSARFVTCFGGNRYVMHFSNRQLETLMSVVLDAARHISVTPSLTNQTLRGEPVCLLQGGDGGETTD